MKDRIVTVSMLVCAETSQRAAMYFAEFLHDNSEVLTYEVREMSGQIRPDLIDLTICKN